MINLVGEPNNDCVVCHGKGFYYSEGWAETCNCKEV